MTGARSDRDIAATAVATEAISHVVDPEIPVLSIAEMGIVRRVESIGARVEVDVTPTYSGCPAMDRITEDIEIALAAVGLTDVVIQTVYSPAWTTDWITERGRSKLAEFGIAPPAPAGSTAPRSVSCPRCSAADTRTVSEFGSTACKALMVCAGCGEPFDYFKDL